MSPDNVSVFIKKYAEQARVFCTEVPEKVHAHLFRHSPAGLCICISQVFLYRISKISSVM